MSLRKWLIKKLLAVIITILALSLMLPMHKEAAVLGIMGYLLATNMLNGLYTGMAPTHQRVPAS